MIGQHNQKCSLKIETLESRQLMAADLVAGGFAEPVDTVEAASDYSDSAESVSYLKYKLDRCFIKSWSTSGDADDTPTDPSKIDAVFAQQDDLDGDSSASNSAMSWDNTAQKKWTDR